MTTIAWDGKELVSDSRVTTTIEHAFANKPAKVKTKKTDNFHHKLLSGDSFMFEGEQVEAIGYSGNVKGINILSTLGLAAIASGIKVDLVKDFTTMEQSKEISYTLLLVMANYIAIINQPIPGETISSTTGSRDARAIIGSGYEVTKLLLDTDLSARNIVSFACAFDSGSGGKLCVWNGKTFQVNVPRPWNIVAIYRARRSTRRLKESLKQQSPQQEAI